MDRCNCSTGRCSTGTTGSSARSTTWSTNSVTRGVPYVTAILAGPLALGPRIGGPVGSMMVALARRLHPAENPQPVRLDFMNVTGIGHELLIGCLPEELNSLQLEGWMRDEFI